MHLLFCEENIVSDAWDHTDRDGVGYPKYAGELERLNIMTWVDGIVMWRMDSNDLLRILEAV